MFLSVPRVMFFIYPLGHLTFHKTPLPQLDWALLETLFVYLLAKKITCYILVSMGKSLGYQFNSSCPLTEGALPLQGTSGRYFRNGRF